MTWVTISAMSAMPAMAIFSKRNRTSRLLIPVNLPFETLRLRFSNHEGRHVGRVDHVRLAKCTESGALLPGTEREVLFSGAGSVSLRPGEELFSDELHFPCAPGETLAVSVYCRERPQTVMGLGEYVFVADRPGDRVGEPMKKDLEKELRAISRGQAPVYQIPYLRAVDVLTEAAPVVMSCLGDSITQQCKWFAPLQKALYESHPGALVLLNHGICGNMFTKDAGLIRMFGKAGVKRADWDSFADYGVTHLLFALGVNDVSLGGVAAEGFAEACRGFVAKAHAKGLRVAAVSLFPAKLDKKEGVREKEELRLAYNALLGEGIFDARIELEAALKNPDAPGYRAGYATGDGVHLNHRGGEAAAEAILRGLPPFLASP